ncbi:MAG: alpha/beta hydrolase [Roseinatronobacter sp.]
MTHALRVLMVLVLLALALPGSAPSITLPRADGAALTARLSGDWARCGPTLILSHGLGGDERALGWLSDAAVQAGYRVFTRAHPESGPRALIRAGLHGAEAVLTDPALWQARARDLDAALDHARRAGCRPIPLVLGGHSMGAAQVMVEAGAQGRFPYPAANLFDAFIAVSPQGPGIWAFAGRDAWR